MLRIESPTPQPALPPASSSAGARLLVLGGSGRLGTLLRRAWALRGAPQAPGGAPQAPAQGPIWQRRRPEAGQPGDPLFDPLTDPAALRDAARGSDAILCLAGVVTGDAAALSANTALAQATLAAARAAGVGQVFLISSAAVYGRVEGPARETSVPRPLSDYGQAKLAMEVAAADWAARAGAGAPRVTCLRLGNVAGADQLLGPRREDGPRPLDLLADGKGPARSYIGPRALAAQIAALAALAKAGAVLPAVINLALDGPVRMDDLLGADGRGWVPRPAPAGLIGAVWLDVARLTGLIGAPARADAAAIVADLRALRPGAQTRSRQGAGR